MSHCPELCLCDTCFAISRNNGYGLREEQAKNHAGAAEEVRKIVSRLTLPALQQLMAFVNNEATSGYATKGAGRMLVAYCVMAHAGPLINLRYREIHEQIKHGRTARDGGN